MLKEKVAELLWFRQQGNAGTAKWEEVSPKLKAYFIEEAKPFHNLYMAWFNSIVDKLTVIDDEELTETAEMIFNFGIDIVGIKNLLWQQNKHQLQDIKKQILDLTGE